MNAPGRYRVPPGARDPRWPNQPPQQPVTPTGHPPEHHRSRLRVHDWLARRGGDADTMAARGAACMRHMNDHRRTLAELTDQLEFALMVSWGSTSRPKDDRTRHL